ncbi:MAG: hypothetical protein GY938_16715 [Ketobacter sp.]|nr:hypothetical protein [Ketobacter sp.]
MEEIEQHLLALDTCGDLPDGVEFKFLRGTLTLDDRFRHGFFVLDAKVIAGGVETAVASLLEQYNRKLALWFAGMKASTEMTKNIYSARNGVEFYPFDVNPISVEQLMNGKKIGDKCIGVEFFIEVINKGFASRLFTHVLWYESHFGFCYRENDNASKVSLRGIEHMEALINWLKAECEQVECFDCEGDWECSDCKGEDCGVCEGYTSCGSCDQGKVFYWIEEGVIKS